MDKKPQNQQISPVCLATFELFWQLFFMPSIAKGKLPAHLSNDPMLWIGNADPDCTFIK